MLIVRLIKFSSQYKKLRKAQSPHNSRKNRDDSPTERDKRLCSQSWQHEIATVTGIIIFLLIKYVKHQFAGGSTVSLFIPRSKPDVQLARIIAKEQNKLGRPLPINTPLQNKLTVRFSGAPKDWCPVPEGEDGRDSRPCLAHSVSNRENRFFSGHFLAAKVLGGSDDKDAIWKQTEDGSWESFFRAYNRTCFLRSVFISLQKMAGRIVKPFQCKCYAFIISNYNFLLDTRLWQCYNSNHEHRE